MTRDWSWALRVGGIGFGMVLVILVVLYLALSIIGKISARLSSAKTRTDDKK